MSKSLRFYDELPIWVTVFIPIVEGNFYFPQSRLKHRNYDMSFITIHGLHLNTEANSLRVNKWPGKWIWSCCVTLIRLLDSSPRWDCSPVQLKWYHKCLVLRGYAIFRKYWVKYNRWFWSGSQGRVLITQIISKICMGKRIVLAALDSFSELWSRNLIRYTWIVCLGNVASRVERLACQCMRYSSWAFCNHSSSTRGSGKVSRTSTSMTSCRRWSWISCLSRT